METTEMNGQSTSRQMDSSNETAWARFESTLQSARDNYGPLEEQLLEAGREAIEAADNFVKDNPWQAVGIGAAAGLLLGLLIGRSR